MVSFYSVFIIALICSAASCDLLTGVAKLPEPTIGPIADNQGLTWTIPIRDQGKCTTAYAQVVASAMGYAAKSSNPLDSTKLATGGCKSKSQSQGLKNAFNVAKKGVKETSSPNALRAVAASKPATFKGNSCGVQLGGDEAKLKQYLKENGPGIVMIDPKCVNGYTYGAVARTATDTLVNGYPMMLIGYGNSKLIGPFFLLQNSKGKTWGESGTMRIKAGSNNCGIANVFMTICNATQAA